MISLSTITYAYVFVCTALTGCLFLQMSGAAHNVTSLSAADPAFNPVSDWVCWLVEGVFILVIGIVGLVSNGFSLVVYSRQNVHRIFHNLLLSLALFDMVSEYEYVVLMHGKVQPA